MKARAHGYALVSLQLSAVLCFPHLLLGEQKSVP